MLSFIDFSHNSRKEKEGIKQDTKRSQTSSMQFLLLSILVLCLLTVYLLITLPTELADTLHRRNIPTISNQPERYGENDRPVIGILTQELDASLISRLPKGHNYTSYLAASYVQWVMAGGARVVPVIIGQDQQYYQQLFNSLNGLLLPGGSAPLTGSGGYAEVGGLFYEMAKTANDGGEVFPVWGTCNGFELLTVLSSKDISRLTDCDSQDDAVPLHFLPHWEHSNIFSSAPPDVIREITEEKITINFHNHCMTPTNFTRYGMDKFWNPLSTNYDRHNLEYLSTIEAKNYPFIGVQFHPEKNIFEWSVKEPRIPHSRHAVHVSLYFATHFVNLARSSTHRFTDRETLERFLSYRYQPLFIGNQEIDSTFEQAYLF